MKRLYLLMYEFKKKIELNINYILRQNVVDTDEKNKRYLPLREHNMYLLSYYFVVQY